MHDWTKWTIAINSKFVRTKFGFKSHIRSRLKLKIKSRFSQLNVKGVKYDPTVLPALKSNFEGGWACL